MSEIHRVVFDTNILFSSVGWFGNSFRCVEAARHEECVSITCEEILTELRENLELKRRFSSSKAAEVTDEIRSFSEVVAIAGMLKVVEADPDDDPVLECAVLEAIS